MLTEPVTFSEAVKYIEEKADRPTALRSAELAAAWSDEARASAFFSARVATTDILTELHRRASQVVNGEMTDKQGVELLARWMDNDGEGLLADLGFMPPRMATESVAELGSTRRLQLIIDTQSKMANEVGAWQQWQDSAEMYPYGVWRLGISEEHRKTHAIRDGLVYPIDHEVWRNDPPGNQFNCHCYREEITAEQAAARGLRPEPLYPVNPPPDGLGFDPSRGFPPPPPVKAKTLPELKKALDNDKANSEKSITSEAIPLDKIREISLGIAEEMEENPDADYGIRMLPHDLDKVEIGDSIPNSFNWVDGENTMEDIGGVSTIGVSKIDKIDKSIKHFMKNSYFGKKVALIRGERVSYGNDPGEVVIASPLVSKIWNVGK